MHGDDIIATFDQLHPNLPWREVPPFRIMLTHTQELVNPGRGQGKDSRMRYLDPGRITGRPEGSVNSPCPRPALLDSPQGPTTPPQGLYPDGARQQESVSRVLAVRLQSIAQRVTRPFSISAPYHQDWSRSV